MAEWRGTANRRERRGGGYAGGAAAEEEEAVAVERNGREAEVRREGQGVGGGG